MAGIVKLGNRPKVFKEILVAVTLPDGEEGIIPVTFKYMSKTEFGKWQDETTSNLKNAAASGVTNAQQDVEFSWEKLYEQSGEKAAETLFGVIQSWGLDVELSVKAIREVESDCGAAALPALFAAFGLACREGRLGN